MWPWGSLLDRQEAIDVAVGFLRAGLGVQRRNKRGLRRQTAGWWKLPRSIEAFEAKKDKFHTCGGPRRRPCLGEGRGRRIFFWNLESWILNPPSLESRSFSEPWSLNLESYPLGFKIFFWALNLESWILPPWIQEVSFGILNLESLDSSFFSEPWTLNLEFWILHPWIQVLFWNLESCALRFGE